MNEPPLPRGLDTEEAHRGLDKGDKRLSVEKDHVSSNDPTIFTGDGG